MNADIGWWGQPTLFMERGARAERGPRLRVQIVFCHVCSLCPRQMRSRARLWGVELLTAPQMHRAMELRATIVGQGPRITQLVPGRVCGTLRE